MKTRVWVAPNKMLFESGHETFDRQTNWIGTGNVLANTQTSSYIRPHSQTECDGRTFLEGQLRAFDLDKWELPPHVRRAVVELTETQPIILYQFHHWEEDSEVIHGREVIHGYVLTRPDHRLLASFVTGPTRKSRLVIREATKYITEGAYHPPWPEELSPY